MCWRRASNPSIEIKAQSFLVADGAVKPAITSCVYFFRSWLSGVDKLHTCYVAFCLSRLSVYHLQLPGRQVDSVASSYSAYIHTGDRKTKSTSCRCFHRRLIHLIKHYMSGWIHIGSCCTTHTHTHTKQTNVVLERGSVVFRNSFFQNLLIAVHRSTQHTSKHRDDNTAHQWVKIVD